MKAMYTAPVLELTKLASEDILNKSDVLIDGGALFQSAIPTDDEE